MLCRKFELIPITIGFLKFLQKPYKATCTCQLMKLMLFSSLSMLCGNSEYTCTCNGYTRSYGLLKGEVQLL